MKATLPQKKTQLRRLKQRVMAAYGGRCVCCGEDRLRFLTLEHTVSGSGKRDRAKFKTVNVFYYWLQKNNWPQDKGYTVLCIGCNWVTRFGEACPHTYEAVAYGWCV